MKKLEQRVPNLRFKGFTDDWEQRKLGEISERILRKNSDLQSLLPLTISAQDGLVDQTIYFNKQVASKQLKNYLLLYNGDFAYNKSYSVGYPYGAIKRLDKYKQGVLSTLYIAFKPTNINSDFLQHYYDTDKWYREIYRNAAEGARNHGLLNISANDFFNSKLITPSDNDEQLKIAKIINVFNRLITLQQRKLDLLKQLKKGFLQKMFADKDSKQPVLRFKGFHDDWERRKLGEAAEIIGGGTPSTQISNYWNGDINWYTPAEISNFIYTRKSKRKISMEGLENSSARLLPVGTVLFTSRAGIGKTAILSKEGTTNQGFQSIVPNKKLLDSYFIFSLTNELKKYGETHGAGSTFIEISGRELAKAPLKLPALKEQKKIGGLLHQVDELISLQQQKLAKYQSIKKSLLQQMFI
ncbi:restriction endonuclease subunit S [Limosilactobacillus reuteri]